MFANEGVALKAKRFENYTDFQDRKGVVLEGSLVFIVESKLLYRFTKGKIELIDIPGIIDIREFGDMVKKANRAVEILEEILNVEIDHYKQPVFGKERQESYLEKVTFLEGLKSKIKGETKKFEDANI